MSYFSIREKIWFDRLLNAEQIRKSIKYAHYIKEQNQRKFRCSEEETSDQIFRIGKSLKELRVLREKRSLIQVMQKNKTKFNKSIILKPRIRHRIFDYEDNKKIKLSTSWVESVSPSAELPRLPRSGFSTNSPFKKKINLLDLSLTLINSPAT